MTVTYSQVEELDFLIKQLRHQLDTTRQNDNPLLLLNTSTTACYLGGNTVWVLLCFLLVLTMMPALALFEAGLLRSKNTLSIVVQIMTGIVLNGVLWYLFGYSLVFGPTKAGLIGDLSHSMLFDLDFQACSRHAPTIPENAFFLFQMTFAAITPLLLTGAYAERLLFKPFVILTVVFEVFVYYPLAHWIFSGDGWLNRLGIQDFAGGIVIHSSAGAASVVCAMMLGQRRDFKEIHGEAPPSNIPLAVVGGSLLWLGWFGFNGGSVGFNGGSTPGQEIDFALAALVLVNTQIGASLSAITWMCLHWIKHRTPPHSLTVLNGTIAGLAGLTPACGYIRPPTAMAIGVACGLSSYYGIVLLKEKLKIDDALDVSCVHGIPGIVGSLAVGLGSIHGINSNGVDGVFAGYVFDSVGWRLLGVQLLGIVVAITYALLITWGCLASMRKAGIQLRASADVESSGLDIHLHGETAYHDMVLTDKEIERWLPHHYRSQRHDSSAEEADVTVRSSTTFISMASRQNTLSSNASDSLTIGSQIFPSTGISVDERSFPSPLTHDELSGLLKNMD